MATLDNRDSTQQAMTSTQPSIASCVDLCGGLYVTVDLNYVVTSINEGGCIFLGHPSCEIVGRSWLDAVVEADDRKAVSTSFSKAILGGGDACVFVEYAVVTASGDMRTVACRVKPLLVAEQVTGIQCFGLDVTPRVQETKVLRENEQRLRAILYTAVDGIITIDDHGTIESFNPACENMFGYQASEAIGLNIRSMMPRQFSERHDEYLSNYRTTRQRRLIGTGREVLGMRRDGTTFPLVIAISETKLPNGRCIFTGILKDVSNRRQAEQELKDANERLMVQTMFNQRLSALAAMAGGVAHELNQPLSGIRVYAQTLMNYLESGMTLDGEDGKQILQSVITQVDRAAGIIDHMRTFASESSSSRTAVVNLHESIDGVLGLIGQQLNNHGIVCHNDVDVSAFVMVDPHRLEQVLINLLANAKDSILEKGACDVREIRVSTILDDQQAVCLSIADTGSGIAEEVKNQLFEPFVTTKGPDRGTGLGLAICHGILQDYGARICLADTSSAGTVFQLTFKKMEPS